MTAFSASLPVGAGLGSSAALCVATSAALTRLSDTISRGGAYGDDGDRPVGSKPGKAAGAGEVRGENGDAAAAATTTEGEGVGAGEGAESGCSLRPPACELERINAWAFAGETVLHGTPSGLDNTVSCYGGAIRFVKGMDGAANTTEVSKRLLVQESGGFLGVAVVFCLPPAGWLSGVSWYSCFISARC